MKNVMIDIETMGTHISQSLILSVGAVAFDLDGKAPIFGETNLLKILAIEPQLLKGRSIEAGTQKWWSEQTPAAREYWESTREKIHPAYLRNELSLFLEKHLGASTLIWANGIVFDLGNLENLFSQYDGTPPWKYNVTRDTRTVYNILPQIRKMPEELKFEGHDPLQDCYKQIWRLWEKWPAFSPVSDVD